MHSGSDPFAKVKGLISDMISRLEAEAAADADEKSYCDKEMSESEAKRSDKQAEVDKLTTQIDQMSAKAKQLRGDVAALQKALADTAAAQAEMNKLRQEEHSDFVSNKNDMQQGLEGIKLALKILREYYASDGKAHASAEGAGAGIVGLLEVCESDFSKDLAEIVSNEDAAQSAYDRATKENEIATAQKTQASKYKSAEAARLEKAVGETSTDRAAVQNELDAVLDYIKTLRGRCVAKAETYAERTARRDAELAGLNKALEILESEAALLQKSSHHRLRANASVHTPITEKVSIEGVEVYSQSAGFDDVNKCLSFPKSMVNDDSKPSVTVCGTSTKITVYLMNRCDEYHKYQEFAGVCNTKADSTTCQTISPATQGWMATAQSYKIETC
jgi:chromosome segregation ATPase